MASEARTPALAALLTASLCLGLLKAQTPVLGPSEPPAERAADAGGPALRTNIPYGDAKAVLDVLRDDLLPAELMSGTPAEREAIWPDWVSRRDAEIRARLARADEDSVLNLLLLGTTFTARPRVTDLASLRDPGAALEIIGGRLDDMIAAVASSNLDERLRFVREVIEHKGIDPTTVEGRQQARRYLLTILARVIGETEGFAQAGAAMSQLDDPMAKLALDATLYRDRGLSSDTSLVPSFAIERALQDLKLAGRLEAGEVRRVAIVGPGLDVIDKREGHDFYPVQTIQPFAVIDSLIRLGLAARDDLRVTTFDISPQVNRHLEAARQQARSGGAYVVQLPLGTHERWHPELVSYWERFGDGVGEEAEAAAPAPADGSVRIRAVRVRPGIVVSVIPQDLNIVLQRLEPLPHTDRFDLIIATNILIYYDIFEQSLAAANAAKMLRPGGLLLSNNLIIELPTSPMSLISHSDVVYTDSAVGDRILAYELRGGSIAPTGNR